MVAVLFFMGIRVCVIVACELCAMIGYMHCFSCVHVKTHVLVIHIHQGSSLVSRMIVPIQ